MPMHERPLRPDVLQPVSAPIAEQTTARGAALPSRSNVHAIVRGPSIANYDAQALGPSGQSVVIRLTNTGARVVDIGRARVSFAATREGVAFECNSHEAHDAVPHEPSLLAPSAAFEYARMLDCTMPLLGSYEVRVFVRFEHPGETTSAPADLAGAFAMDLVTRGAAVPRACPSRPGLYAMMTGAKATQPLPPDAWARGDYHLVVALINGSARPVHVGAARISVSIKKKGSPLPCAGQAILLAMPESLAPGAMHLAPVSITCAPSEEGNYDVTGTLGFDDGRAPIEIGQMTLKVTSDPRLFAPIL